MYALIDCNSFYVSCEKAFRPDLAEVPGVVLSNNDGCVIALDKAAKAAGVRMGTPEFEARALLKAQGVVVFSSNYTLYGDMSRRVMNVLARECPRIEVYSVDECFADLRGMAEGELEAFGHRLRTKVGRGCRIPVSVGIAPTKTLAKMANKLAKRGEGVLVMTEATREDWLRRFPLEDVWGIGRQHLARLAAKRCRTAWDFCRLDEGWVRQEMTIVGARMQQELRGVACLEMTYERAQKKGICTSRSFGRPLTLEAELSEAVATHAQRCSEKLRRQKSAAGLLTLFLETNRFRPELPQYCPSRTVSLAVASSNAPELVGTALALLKELYRDGYRYKKCGVIVTGIQPENPVQAALFDDIDRERANRVSAVMDGLNRRYGQDVVRTAAQGYSADWRLRADRKSPCYTTRWEDVPVVRCR